ncbi:sugar ABC transporter permease [Chloroflexi bacterium TSY]|nr:sugar ABC transporter permease [Chloroflexi bacterium TSY]
MATTQSISVQHHTRSARRRSRTFWQRTVAGYTFITPNFIAFLVFVAGPVIAGLLLSFTEWDLLTPPVFIGLDNYIDLLTDDKLFWQSLTNTLYYSILTVSTGIVVSLALALMLNQPLSGVRFYRTIFFIPVVSSSVAVALVWKWFYNGEFGILNWLLDLINLPPQNWLTSQSWAMPAVALTVVWKGMGYNMVIFLAGLQDVPESLHEAAAIDGANAWQRFWRITLPLLRPHLFFVLVVSIIGSFQAFDMVYVMTGGGPGNATLVYNYHIWQNAFQFFKMGYASAMAYILFFLIFLITLIQVRLLGRRTYYELG